MKSILLFIISLFLPNSLLAAEIKDISQEELIARQKTSDDFLILDVRTVNEFNKGHVKGAVNISHTDILDRLNDIPKDKDLIIYCRSGKRAGIAADLLAKNGYKQLFHLLGDMNGWQENNRPISVD